MYKLIASTILAVALLGPSAGATESSPAAMASPSGHHLLSHFVHSKRPAGLPRKWDKRIPLPEGVTVKEVKPPTGAAQAVEFSAPGDFDQDGGLLQGGAAQGRLRTWARGQGSRAQGI